jgi:hypothetical protein
MKNPERTIAEIRLLSTHFGETCLDEDDPSVVLIPCFDLPEGYNQTQCEVLIDLGPQYPELPPQDFYLSRGLTKYGRTPAHYYEDFVGKKYCGDGFAWYSFHIKRWRPGTYSMLDGDNLLAATGAFYKALATD